MAGLYRRGVQRSAGTPMMQVQGSQGAGGAIPRGGNAPNAQQQGSDASKKIQTLGGLLGMMNQHQQAQQDIAPAMAAADQTQANINALANPSFGVKPAPMASSNGEWGGVQMNSFGPGVPMPSGDWSGAANGAVPNFAANAGLELPGMASTAPAGAMTTFGGGIPSAAANTASQAASNLQLPQGLLDMLPDFSFGGAGA